MTKGLGVFVGSRPDGKVQLARLRGKCTPLETGDKGAGLVVGVGADRKPIIAWSDQKCKTGTTSFEAGKKYLGLVTGVTDDGVPIISSWCEECESTDNPTVCGCEICCTLTGTLSVNDGSDGWTEPVEVELTCGGTIETTVAYFCLNDDVEDDLLCVKYTVTWAEKDTTGSPTPYTDGATSGTETVRTVIWSSGSFDIGSTTYRMSYWVTERIRYQSSPTVTTITTCTNAPYIQQLRTLEPPYECQSPFWAPLLGSGGAVLSPEYFTVTDDSPYSGQTCPEGYSDAGGELDPGLFRCGHHPTGFGDPYTSGGSGFGTDCPVFYVAEAWDRLIADPDDCDHRIPCARYSIIDKCTPQLACSLGIAAGGFDTVDFEVEGCHAGSGTHVTNGNPPLGSDMFAGGTGMILSPYDTYFDEGDGVEAPDAYWADTEEMNWVISDSLKGNIQLALCCVYPEEGEPYLAAYAMLTLTCYEPPGPGPCGSVAWSYKTRDLDVRIVNGYLEVSFTGLTPMGTASGPGTCPCECDPPALSVTMRRQISDCP